MSQNDQDDLPAEVYLHHILFMVVFSCSDRNKNSKNHPRIVDLQFAVKPYVCVCVFLVGEAAAAVCLPEPGGEAAGESESGQEAGGG